MEMLKDLFYKYYGQSDICEELGEMPEVKETIDKLNEFLKDRPLADYLELESVCLEHGCAMEMQGWVYGYMFAVNLLTGINLSAKTSLNNIISDEFLVKEAV